jgi:hypothetical protein
MPPPRLPEIRTRVGPNSNLVMSHVTFQSDNFHLSATLPLVAKCWVYPKYEIGQDAVPLHRLLNFAKVCGVSPETFWSHASAAPVPTGVGGADDKTIVQLVRAYRRITNAEQRKRILLLVKQMAGEDEKSAGS